MNRGFFLFENNVILRKRRKLWINLKDYKKKKKGLERKQELEAQIDIIKEEQKNKGNEISNCYQEFFDRKQNKEFVLYERFPSKEMLQAYKSRRFPLYENG